jgi:hypothetical protein
MSAQEHEREYQLMVKTIPASYDYGQGLPPDNMIHILHDTFSGDRERWTRPLSLPVGDIHPVQHISVFLETGVPTNCRFALPYGAGPARDAFYRLKTLYRCKVCGASSIRPFTAKHESTKDHLGAVAIQFKEQNGAVSLHDLFRKTIGTLCESVFISHIIRYEGCYKINNLYMVNSQLAGIIDTWLKSGVQGDDPYRYGYRSRGLEFSVLAKSLKDAGVKKKRSNLAGICCKCNEPGVADYLVKTVSVTMEFCRKHGELLEVVLDKMDEMEAIK